MESILKYITASIVAIFAIACTDNPDYPAQKIDYGTLDFSNLNVTVDQAENPLSKTEEISVEPWRIAVINNSDSMLLETTVETCPASLKIKADSPVTLLVESNEVADAAWDSPYYAATRLITVAKDETIQIDKVVCRLSNIRVSVIYDASLRHLISAESHTTVKASESGMSLNFGVDEYRSGYFRSIKGSTTLGAVFEGSIKNRPIVITKALTGIQPGSHCIFTFKLSNTTDSGSVSGELAVDCEATVVDIDGNLIIEEVGDSEAKRPGEQGGTDDPTPPTGDCITITSAGMVFDTPMDPKQTTDGLVLIHADKGIENLRVQIVTDPNGVFYEVLNSVEVPMDFDLAHPDAKTVNAAESLGFCYGDQVLHKTDVEFNITQFFPLLIYSGTHKFVLTVTDTDGNSLSRSIIFQVD